MIVPRPRSAAERDEMVLDFLREFGPTSKYDLASSLQLSQDAIYISLHRLNQAKKITRVRGRDGHFRNLWTLAP